MYYKCRCKDCSMVFDVADESTRPSIPLCADCGDADCDINGKEPCRVKWDSPPTIQPSRETVTIPVKEEPRGCAVGKGGDVALVDTASAEMTQEISRVSMKTRWERFKAWRPWKALGMLVIVSILGACEGDGLTTTQEASACPEGQAPASAWGGTCQPTDPAWWPLIGPMRSDCPFGWGPSPVTTDPTQPFWTCVCEQGCGPCPDGWHKAGEWGATCERDAP